VGGVTSVMAMVCAAAQPGPPSLPLANRRLEDALQLVA